MTTRQLADLQSRIDFNLTGPEDVEALYAEVGRLRAAIRRHRDQKGDDRCWLDDYALYEALDESIPDHACRLNDPETMLADCRRFVESRHDPAKPYLSPQREIERLTGELDRLRRIAGEGGCHGKLA